jgi:hypothetical protein
MLQTTQSSVLRRFVVQSLLLWGLGVAPWPKLGSLCESVFGGFAELVIGWLLGDAAEITTSPAVDLGEWTTLIGIVTAAGEQFTVGWEFRRVPFLSLVTYLALVFGYPQVTRRTRATQLLLGSIVIPTLSLTRIVAMLATPPVAVLELPAWLETSTVVLARAFVLPPGMTYAVPCGLWLLTLFCLEPMEFLANLKRLLPEVNLDKPSAPAKQRAGDH